jgi:hypothetical protein
VLNREIMGKPSAIGQRSAVQYQGAVRFNHILLSAAAVIQRFQLNQRVLTRYLTILSQPPLGAVTAYRYTGRTGGVQSCTVNTGLTT